MSPRAAKKAPKSTPATLRRGETLALRDIGRLEPKERQHVQTWLKRNFCKADNYGCKLSVLADGGLHLEDPDDSVGGAEEFKVHLIDLDDGTPAFLAVMFVGGSEGSLYDRRKRRVAALAIEGELAEIGADYEDLAPELSRLVPGVKAIPKAPKKDRTFPPPPGAPASGEAWRAMFPEKEAQRTIDLLVRSVEQHRLERGTNLHWAFENDLGIPPRKQPSDPYEWLCAARTLEFHTDTLIDRDPLSDVRPLAVFKNLHTLSLPVLPDADLTPLAALRALETLSIRGGNRSNFGWLASLKALKELSISGGSVASDAIHRVSLQGNIRLKSFSFLGCPADLSSLDLPASLESLELRGPVSDASPLSHLVRLDHLDLSGCRIRDLSGFHTLRKLEWLELRDNLIESLAGIEKIPKLHELEIEDNCIVDFGPATAWRKFAEDPEEVNDWIECSHDSQVDLSSPAGRAVLRDWDSVEAWEALAAHFDADKRTRRFAKDIRACLAGKEPDSTWFGGHDLPRR